MNSRSRFLSFFACAALFCGSLSIAPALNAGALSQTATAVQMSADGQAHKFLRTAGTAITAGSPVYLSPTDNLEYPADADAASPAYKVEGIAVQSVAANQPVLVCWQDAKFKPGATLVIGDTLWLFTTAGTMTKTSTDIATGMFVSVLGVAVSTSEMNLKIVRSDVVKP